VFGIRIAPFDNRLLGTGMTLATTDNAAEPDNNQPG
jgi:hypothetical protein